MLQFIYGIHKFEAYFARYRKCLTRNFIIVFVAGRMFCFTIRLCCCIDNGGVRIEAGADGVVNHMLRIAYEKSQKEQNWQYNNSKFVPIEIETEAGACHALWIRFIELGFWVYRLDGTHKLTPVSATQQFCQMDKIHESRVCVCACVYATANAALDDG